MGKRHTTRLLSGVSGCALLLGSCAGSTPHVSRRTTTSTSTTTAPSSTVTSGPLAASECTFGQVSWQVPAIGPGDTEDLGFLVVATNTSAQPCYVVGRPPATALLSTGQSRPAGVETMTDSLPPDAGNQIMLKAGSVAYLRFRDPSACSSGVNSSPPSYVSISFPFDQHNVELKLTGRAIPASCGFPLYESPFYF
jgi:hypothetical protein